MRIHVSHQTTYDYALPAKSLIQTLRLTPRNHDGQFVVHWRIDVDLDSRLKPGEDAFGNVTHLLSVGGPLTRLVVTVDGEVQTHDTAGIVRGTVERFPPPLFLRDTPLTTADDAVRALADDVAGASGPEALSRLHGLMAKVGDTLAIAADGPQEAAQALAEGRADSAGHAHLFVAAARHLGIPARTISGYLWQEVPGAGSGVHFWSEAHVEGLGWVAFDTANRTCPSTAHVRVAMGLDCAGAAPVRGSHHGGGDERQASAVRVMAQSQSQN
ncbi:transglutaminase family protein [uncultured Alsobacter sp.]|uniref:transglutaminase family protein n=1 Tax=uncultured Alsobacter sp. TaxID=1748258 RepID=UPI0025D73051|nr:transglutaminase family protein [uncultured Alsobacter sp.]